MEDVATVKKMTVKTTALLLSSSLPFFCVDTLHVLTEPTKIVRFHITLCLHNNQAPVTDYSREWSKMQEKYD